MFKRNQKLVIYPLTSEGVFPTEDSLDLITQTIAKTDRIKRGLFQYHKGPDINSPALLSKELSTQDRDSYHILYIPTGDGYMYILSDEQKIMFLERISDPNNKDILTGQIAKNIIENYEKDVHKEEA